MDAGGGEGSHGVPGTAEPLDGKRQGHHAVVVLPRRSGVPHPGSRVLVAEAVELDGDRSLRERDLPVLDGYGQALHELLLGLAGEHEGLVVTPCTLQTLDDRVPYPRRIDQGLRSRRGVLDEREGLLPGLLETV